MARRSPFPRLRRGDTRPLYTGLRVRNLGRSVRFYRALGFRPTFRGKTALGEFAQLEHPIHHFTVELNHFNPGSWHYETYERGSEMDHFGFWVSDVDATVQRLVKVGGKLAVAAEDCRVVIPPRPWFDGRAAFVADPDGIWIEIMGPSLARSPHRRRSAVPRTPSDRRREPRPSVR